jgi:hypothetical protein
MVAMPTVDLIVTSLWVGGLSVVVLAQAILLYVRHHMATRRAEGAARLADAISFPPGGRDAVRARPASDRSAVKPPDQEARAR